MQDIIEYVSVSSYCHPSLTDEGSHRECLIGCELRKSPPVGRKRTAWVAAASAVHPAVHTAVHTALEYWTHRAADAANLVLPSQSYMYPQQFHFKTSRENFDKT